MNPMRRSFLKGAGIIGAFGAGLAAPVIVERVRETQIQPTAPKKEDISHLAPEQNNTLTLMGNPKPVEKVESPHGQYYLVASNPEYQNKVNLSVGKDNRLWVQVDGKWNRVALEEWCDPTYCDPAPI